MIRGVEVGRRSLKLLKKLVHRAKDKCTNEGTWSQTDVIQGVVATLKNPGWTLGKARRLADF